MDDIPDHRAREFLHLPGFLFVFFNNDILGVQGFIDPVLPFQIVGTEFLAGPQFLGGDKNPDLRLQSFLLKLFDVRLARKGLDQVGADAGDGESQDNDSDDEYLHLSLSPKSPVVGEVPLESPFFDPTDPPIPDGVFVS